MLTACCDFALRSYNSNNGLLRANVEALSAGEGVEDCDIYKYNRNQAEAAEIAVVQWSMSAGYYVEVRGRKISLGAEAKLNGAVRVFICIDSQGNCCAKSWILKPVEYL